MPASVDLQINGLLPELEAHVRVAHLERLAIAGLLPELEAEISALYDTRTQRPTVGSTRSAWQDGERVSMYAGSTWTDALPLRAGVAARGQEAARLASDVALHIADAARCEQEMLGRWQDATLLAAGPYHFRLADGLHGRDFHIDVRWQDGALLQRAAKIDSSDGLRFGSTAFRSAWQTATGQSLEHGSGMGAGVAVSAGWRSPWQKAIVPPAGIWTRPVVPPGGDPCYLQPPGGAVELVFADAWDGSSAIVFVCERHGGGHNPDPPRHFIPLLEVYMSVHAIECVLMPGLEPVTLLDSTITADDDGYAWNLSATGPQQLMEQLAPSGGTPARLRITVDGTDWIFAVESVARTRSAAGIRTQVSGRSITSLLGDPYMPAQTWLSTAARNARQLALEALEFSGVDVGWTSADWQVPAGAWSHQGTPLSAVLRIAEAGGAVVRSHRTDAQLIVAPRYSAMPWEWSDATPDVQIPLAVVTTDSYQPAYRPAWNAVYVGGQSQGVLGHVKRAGTAGEVLAPQVTDALITHADAARQRGRAVLGAGGAQVPQQITLPVLTGGTLPGVLQQGQLLEVLEPGLSWRGMVRGISLRVAVRGSGRGQGIDIRQTATVERHL